MQGFKLKFAIMSSVYALLKNERWDCMGECICESCKNLKSVIDDENGESRFECEFGFPSDECIDCEADGCDLDCDHYEECDDEEEEPVIVHCSRCGKELKKLMQDDEEGEIMCVDCFLKG